MGTLFILDMEYSKQYDNKYKLFALDRNTLNDITVCRLFVIDRNIWNNITVCKLFVFRIIPWTYNWLIKIIIIIIIIIIIRQKSSKLDILRDKSLSSIEKDKD